MHTWRRREATHEPYNCQPDPEPQPSQKSVKRLLGFSLALHWFFYFYKYVMSLWCTCFHHIWWQYCLPKAAHFWNWATGLWPTSAHQKWPTKPIWQRRLGKFKELHVSYFNKSGSKRYSMSCLKQFGLQCDENSNSLMWVSWLVENLVVVTYLDNILCLLDDVAEVSSEHNSQFKYTISFSAGL